MIRATPIIKGKIWIIEKSGEKIATVQAVHGSNIVVLTTSNSRNTYPSINILRKEHNIVFGTKLIKSTIQTDNSVYGFPTDSPPHNGIYNVEQRCPTYTKNISSDKLFCAGHYLLNYSNNWVKVFCPTLLTLTRINYKGPFKTVNDCSEKKKELQNS